MALVARFGWRRIIGRLLEHSLVRLVRTLREPLISLPALEEARMREDGTEDWIEVPVPPALGIATDELARLLPPLLLDLGLGRPLAADQLLEDPGLRPVQLPAPDADPWRWSVDLRTHAGPSRVVEEGTQELAWVELKLDFGAGRGSDEASPPLSPLSKETARGFQAPSIERKRHRKED